MRGVERECSETKSTSTRRANRSRCPATDRLVGVSPSDQRGSASISQHQQHQPASAASASISQHQPASASISQHQQHQPASASISQHQPASASISLTLARLCSALSMASFSLWPAPEQLLDLRQAPLGHGLLELLLELPGGLRSGRGDGQRTEEYITSQLNCLLRCMISSQPHRQPGMISSQPHCQPGSYSWLHNTVTTTSRLILSVSLSLFPPASSLLASAVPASYWPASLARRPLNSFCSTTHFLPMACALN